MKYQSRNIVLLLLGSVVAVLGDVELKFDVAEEQAVNTFIGKINTTAYPPPYNVFETHPDIYFDMQTGRIVTTKKLDRETVPSYTLAVLSMSGTGFTAIKILINVTDINDNVPYFPNGSKSISLSEISPNGSKVHIGSL